MADTVLGVNRHMFMTAKQANMMPNVSPLLPTMRTGEVFACLRPGVSTSRHFPVEAPEGSDSYRKGIR